MNILKGYCIQGNEKHSERIRNVFKIDGANCDNWSFGDESYYYSINENIVEYNTSVQGALISIDKAEEIIKTSATKTKKAIKKITSKIKKDVELRESYKKNIVMAFCNECEKIQTDDDLPLELLHKIANKAADSLLDKWCA